jgi:cell division protein FtsB
MIIIVNDEVYDVIESGTSKEFEEEVKIVRTKNELETFIEKLEDEDKKVFISMNTLELEYIKYRDSFLGVIYPTELFYYVDGCGTTAIYDK